MPSWLVHKNVPKKINCNVVILLIFQKQNDALYLPTHPPTHPPTHQPTNQPTNQPRLGNTGAHHSHQMTDVKLNSFRFIFVEVPVPKYSVAQECRNLLPIIKFQVP